MTWLIALFLLIALGANQTPQTGIKHEHSDKTGNTEASEARKPHNAPQSSAGQQDSNGIPTEDKNQSRAGHTTNPPHDWIDKVNACSTAAIALFTIFLFIGVIRQIRTSKTIERAWVMAEVEHDSDKWADRKPHVLEGSGTGGESTAIYAALVCSNAGKTPAWIEETIAKFEMVMKLPDEPNFESAAYVQRSTIPLGMAEGGAVPHTQKIPWVPTAEGHQRINEMAVIYGRVTYRDIFDKRHTTTFGYKIRPHGKLERLEGRAKYNHNT